MQRDFCFAANVCDSFGMMFWHNELPSVSNSLRDQSHDYFVWLKDGFKQYYS